MTEKPKDAAKTEFTAWVQAHMHILYGYALQRVSDPDVAEELVQETFLAALKNRKQFKQRSSERTWLVSILRYKLVDYIRRQKRLRREQTPLDSLEEPSPDCFNASGHWVEMPAEWTYNPAVIAENEEFWTIFQDCLSRLPKSIADVFILREMEQLRSNNVCKVLKISESNLWVRLHRARLQLRECLEKNWFSGRV